MTRLVGTAALVCLFLAACQTGGDVSGIGGLAFEATSSVNPPPPQNVQVTATVTNVSTNSLDISYGGCTVTPILHSVSLTGPVALDPRPIQACTTQSITKTLDPNQSIQIVGSAAPQSIALVAGKYYVEAIIRVNGDSVSVDAGTVTF